MRTSNLTRLIILFTVLCLLLSGCGGGNYAQTDLQEAVDIPQNGVIKASTLKQLKKENAIATFVGESNGFAYEWTIFGSDITETEDIRLDVEITSVAEGVQIRFFQEEPFGFPGLLSVYLQDTWDAPSATAFQDNKAVSSVSVTGSSQTILNLSVRDVLGTCVIIPDAYLEETIPQENILLKVQTGGGSQETKDEETPAFDPAAYLSPVTESSKRVYSSGGGSGKDKYNTDPVPEGKPMPVEPENQTVDTTRAYTCTFSIECSTILNNLDMLDSNKLEMVPSSGVIYEAATVTFYEGESVYDVLQRVCKDHGIHMEASWTPIYNSAYVEGIHNLYEFDCGALSGWMYKVNGWYPNYGSSRYQLQQGDVVEWRYTCDLGHDIGGAYAVSG